MSLKNLIAVSIGVISCGPAIAMCNSTNNDFYIGSGLSYSNSDTQTQLAIGGRRHFSGQGLGFNFYTGYDFNISSKFTLGFNSFFNIYSVNDKSFSTTTKIKNAFGITIEPGYYIANNINIFTRVGFGGLRAHYYILTPDPLAPNPSETRNKTLGVAVLGVGSRFELTKNIRVRTTYTYYYPRTRPLPSYTSTRTGLGEIMVGASYHF